MKKRCIAVVMCLVLISALCISCGQKKTQEMADENTEDQELKIGITFDTFVLERWIRDRDVFVSTAEKLGATVNVQNANGDVEKQKVQIEKFIEDEMDVIVIVAVDCYQLTEEVTKARNAGIDVISYDRMIQGCSTDLYITVDNEAVGELMAQTMIDRLPEGGNVVMLCGPQADTNSLDVVDGFKNGIQDSNLTVVKEIYVKSWTPENGFAAANEALLDAEDVDAVMCGNDGLAGYAIKALSEKQLAGKVVVVGQDADLEACQRVVEGTQTMTVYKPIERLAKVAAQCAVKMAKGETVVGEEVGRTATKRTMDGYEVPYWALPPIAVTDENMDDIIIDLGFHLRDEVYLNVEE
ncbi:sugar ABC transporter substrate-binding protein [Faecalicatena contorta]|uniref:sugar ABC transporter substrate-binding protein n=1 Tax=Faecalicatena contorta TaxID=39482 RepID=UPI001F20A9C7|nr:substrate-binding domain-containing protein [Faecalicatena contorta]MCF2683169.1 substrate-binding domain-containing protein [Faecalicatena contorta]